jgi:hypothetical protein
VNCLRTSVVRGAVRSVAALFVLHGMIVYSTNCRAQQAPATSAAATDAAVHDLQDQVRDLREMIDEMRAENAQSRAEMLQLRKDLQTTRALLEQHPAEPVSSQAASSQIEAAVQPAAAPTASNASATPQQTATLEQRVEKLEENTSLIGSKVDEQDQTKVETASKYRARLHGIVLMNAFRNVGASDSLDFPDYAVPVAAGASVATLGATLRQSEIGLEIFGQI